MEVTFDWGGWWLLTGEVRNLHELDGLRGVEQLQEQVHQERDIPAAFRVLGD